MLSLITWTITGTHTETRGIYINYLRYVIKRMDFGGTLLGTGGLVRAYGKAAKEGLLSAGIVEMVLYRKYVVTAEYTDSGKVQYEILQGGHELYDTVYTHQVEFTVLVEVDQTEAFEKKMTEIFRGQQAFAALEELYGVWQEGVLRLAGQE